MAADDDFEEELLRVAGRSKSASKKRSRQATESDDEEPAGGSNKGPASAAKKANVTVSDDSEGDDDDAEYSDEGDRAKLKGMTELEREMYLFERAEQREREKQRMAVVDQARKADQAVELRASSRRARTQSHADDAIGKLAAARQKREARVKQREAEQEEEKQQRRKDSDEESEEPALPDEEEEEAEEEAEQEEEEEEEEELAEAAEEEAGYGGGAAPYPEPSEEEEEVSDAHESADYEDLKKIQLRRKQLEEWHEEPFFERAVKGCVVRVVLGDFVDDHGNKHPNIQLLKILEVVHRGSYEFGVRQGAKTDRWLRLDDAGFNKCFQMRYISNQDTTVEEFERYKRHHTKNMHPEITKGEVQDGLKRLEEAQQYKYSTEDIRARLNERRAKGHLLGSVAQERIRLKQQIELAEQENQPEKVEQLRQELEDLDRRAETRDAAAGKLTMADINARNKNLNQRKSFANIGNRPPGQDEIGSGIDVFSRRQTQSRVYWKTGNNSSAAAAADAAVDKGPVRAAEERQLRRTSSGAADTRKLAEHQQKMDPMELVKELPFDIDLGKLRVHLGGSLPRKVLGARWRCVDTSTDLAGKNTLTYMDWKRRMQLNMEQR